MIRRGSDSRGRCLRKHWFRTTACAPAYTYNAAGVRIVSVLVDANASTGMRLLKTPKGALEPVLFLKPVP